MKKLISFFIAFLLVFGLSAPSVSALFDSGTVTSQLLSDIYYLENLDEGTVFFEKNSTMQTAPAGFVKILAAIVAIEKWGNLDGDIKITEKNLNVFDYEDGMTTALYEEGEVVSKRELFDCLVAYSANDALSIIAYEVSGSLSQFVADIQALVAKIGCTATSIKNIHGFDEPDQYTTAADVAKIIKYGLQFPAFNEAFSLEEVTLKETDYNEERTYQASNKMKNAAIADYYHSAVTGGKQTSTNLAGECIAVISNADGYSYLTIVMSGRMEDIDDDYYDENTSMTDARQMLDWVYENIRYKVIATPDQTVATVDIVAGQGTDKLALVPEKETSALVPAMASPASVMFEFAEGQAVESLVAPVEAGDVIAEADVFYAGRKLTTVNLVAAETVKLSFGGLVSSFVRRVVGSVYFLVLTFIAAVIGVLKLVLDMKDFFDMERKRSYEPLPSSFEVLVENIKRKLAFGGRKKPKKDGKGKKPSEKKSPDGKKAPQKRRADADKIPPAKRSAPAAGEKPKRPAKKPAQKSRPQNAKKQGNVQRKTNTAGKSVSNKNGKVK